MTEEVKKEIRESYGRGTSPLTLSLAFNVEVSQIYEVLEQPDMNYVRVSNGDMVDDAGPGAALEGPKVQKQPYSKN